MKKNIVLSTTEQSILGSYKNLVNSLGVYLGQGYEIVLHNLESYESSVIAITNGFHTGRHIGSPITNTALEMLKSLEKSNGNDYITYFSRNKDNKPMKSTTIAIRGENKRVIGLLCINIYLDIPLSTLLNDYTPPADLAPAKTGSLFYESLGMNEEFHDTSHDLIRSLTNSIREEVHNDTSVLSSNKNKVIIAKLYERGVFKFKDSVQIVAQILNISKNTVYLHLRNIP